MVPLQARVRVRIRVGGPWLWWSYAWIFPVINGMCSDCSNSYNVGPNGDYTECPWTSP